LAVTQRWQVQNKSQANAQLGTPSAYNYKRRDLKDLACVEEKYGDLRVPLSEVRPELRVDVFLRKIPKEDKTYQMSQLRQHKGNPAHFRF
jgi:hypothetical protein